MLLDLLGKLIKIELKKLKLFLLLPMESYAVLISMLIG